MSANQTDNDLENRLLNEIEELKRQVRELKANQAPTQLALSGRISVDQTNGFIAFQDGAGNIVVKMGYLGVDGSNNPVYGFIVYDELGVPRMLAGSQSGGF